MAVEKAIYKVSYGKVMDVDAKTVLVRAANKARAERHVARDILAITAERATQEDLVFLLGEGLKVEDAGEEE